MALNPDKSHAILFSTAQKAQSFSSDLHSIDVAGSATLLASHINLPSLLLFVHLKPWRLSENILKPIFSSLHLIAPSD